MIKSENKRSVTTLNPKQQAAHFDVRLKKVSAPCEEVLTLLEGGMQHANRGTSSCTTKSGL